jgi:hypothetical protein
MNTETQTAEGNPAAGAPAGADGYAVGRGRPPLQSQWRKGTSGNPLGRPRRAGFGRRSIPFIPALDAALSRPVEAQLPDGQSGQATVLEMLVYELTHLFKSRYNLGAGRMLLELIIEHEQARVELEVAEAEAAAAAAEAERVAREAKEHAARQAKKWAEADERERLRALSIDSHAHDCDGDCDGECEKDWDEDALLGRALLRLGAGRADRDGAIRLEPWVVDAALARAPEPELSEGERATLALVTAAGGDESEAASAEASG